jgi:acyl-coenzyme A thioesterase PaaI-like protein
MVFADYVLGMAAYERLGMRSSVTMQLNVNLVASARIGDRIEGEAAVVRHVNDIVFMRGRLAVGERTIATADGVWRIVTKTD